GHWVGREAEDVARERARRGGLIGAIDELNHGGRLRPIKPTPLGPLGNFIARFHLGDPARAADSWAPRRRREDLYRQARAAEAALSPVRSKSTISGR
ncbi:MAG: hypothetical protein ACREEH_01175, partial [Caulobacteraceae bacterium]